MKKLQGQLVKNNFVCLLFLLLLTIIFASNTFAHDDDHERQHNSIELDDIKAKAKTPIQLYVFNCGTIVANELSLFNPALEVGMQKTLSNTCYLIKHPKGTLMWDAGLPDSLATIPGGTTVFDGAFTISVEKTLKSQLEEIGIDPLEIDFVALSHLHFDHIGNANYFTNSTWLIQQSEYAVAFGEAAVQAGFDSTAYNELADNPTITLNGHYDVFGDKSVVVISAPGHTVGHQMLYLDLPQTGPVVLSGDLYHFMENRLNYGVPVFNSSIRESIHSFVLIDNFLDQSKAQFWIQHDKPTFDSLSLSPAFYQ
ncbi:MAG: N-acyl homoserine lactonase family protein [Gammaproteobacteria bacterium]|nr:N-acyl homoserine lactonase family protein [Gammaproteobacteria bacterium]MDH5729527.1 N-acyl homoserine lactonase family protein [Gammaproteobacteria bacterium]